MHRIDHRRTIDIINETDVGHHIKDQFELFPFCRNSKFLEDFPTVKKVYGEMYTMRDLEDILALPTAQMEREIVKLPESVKDSMSNLIATQIANGKLDSIAKVRKLSEIFDSDFNLLSDLFVK